MKTPVVTNATLLMLAATPALAMICCGGKGAMMCGKVNCPGFPGGSNF